MKEVFYGDYIPTIDDAWDHVLIVDNERYQFTITEEFNEKEQGKLNYLCMDIVKGFIILYSIDDLSSFEDVESYYNEIIRAKNTTNVPIVICGSKCDLEDKRVISKAEGENLAQRLGVPFFEISALNNTNIEEPFAEVCRMKKRFDFQEHQLKNSKNKAPSKAEICKIN